MSEPNIRQATANDVQTMESLAVAADMFSADEAPFIGHQFRASEAGEVPGARWLVIDDGGELLGAAFYAAEPFADRMWNLYFLVVDPNTAGKGLGTRLVQHIESALRDEGAEVARTLIVETSSTPQYERTRAFYERLGFTREATIRQFYGPDDHKVVFWKSLLTDG